jgi:hypothetical protein
LQLQRLKLHHEKQKQEVSQFGTMEGKKGGQISGVTKETKQVEVQVQRSYAEMVIGDQGMGIALDTQATGEVAPKLSKERAQFKEIAAKNLAQQDMDFLEDQERIMETLISLQKQISSYLRKLEMGWGKKEKETKRDPVVEGDGLKTEAPSGEKEAGLGTDKGTTEPFGDVECLGQLGDQVTQLVDVAGVNVGDTESASLRKLAKFVPISERQKNSNNDD